MADYLPASDVELQEWLANFVTYVLANATAMGLVTGDTAGLTPTKTAFDTALTQHVTAQAAAQSARVGKDAARLPVVTVVRGLVRKLQASSVVSDVQRAAMGITVKDRTPTAVAGSAATTSGASRPIGVVDTSQKLRHEIRFFDENTPTSRAKPANAIGCEIWVKLTDAGATAPALPRGVEECAFVALDTASPYVAEYEGMQGGKTAHYIFRWAYKGGEKGPISEVVSATIVA